MSGKMTFYIDARGRVSEALPDRQTFAETGRKKDCGIKESRSEDSRNFSTVLNHSLSSIPQMASAYDAAPLWRVPPRRRHARRNARASFVPRRKAVRTRTGRDSSSPSRLREAAFAAVAIGTTLGAMLLSAIHGIAGNAAAPPGTPTANSTATSSQMKPVILPSNGQGLVTLANQSGILTFPRFETLLYEAGVFNNLSSANAARRDYLASGVTSFVSSDASYTVLLGPIASADGDSIFEKKLDAAEVPYFIRPWAVGEVARPSSGLTGGQAGKLEQMVTSDVELLQGLIAMRSGYGFPQVSDVAAKSDEDFAQLEPLLDSRLGRLGSGIAQFHESTDEAWHVVMAQGRYKTAPAMSALAKAIVSYASIGHQ